MVTRQEIQATCDDIVREFATATGDPFRFLCVWHADGGLGCRPARLEIATILYLKIRCLKTFYIRSYF